MVLFPIVALGISTLFENYQWTLEALLGIALVLTGNVLIVMSREQMVRLYQRFRPASRGVL
jgi:drug/metabolite transporter (DMT)-like permease